MEIIINPQHLAQVRQKELDKLFRNGRGYDTALKVLTREKYHDGSLRGMPESTQREVKARTKAALKLAREEIELLHILGVSREPPPFDLFE